MGTRNLIVVICENEVKVAQYGQWDGYPSGQGLQVYNFLKSLDIERFKSKLKGVSFFEESELNEIYKNKNALIKYPSLNRDLGANILYAILNDSYSKKFYEDHSHKEIEVPLTVSKLENSFDFGYDPLFCEWAYVIDLDNIALEVYSGNNKLSGGIDERFYKGIKLLKKYSFLDLPSEKEFVEELDNLNNLDNA